MSIEECLVSVETNAMILGIVALNMQNFASQIIQHVNGGGPLDDAELTALKAKYVRSLKNTATEGVPLEQEATALNKALIIFGQMVDDAMLRARAEGEDRSGRCLPEPVRFSVWERGHEIMPRGLFHDRRNDHQEAQKTESRVPVPSRVDRPVACPG